MTWSKSFDFAKKYPQIILLVELLDIFLQCILSTWNFLQSESGNFL